MTLLIGCAPDDYRRDADRQVGRLLKQRTEETLGYEPKVVPAAPAASQPTAKSYSMLPTTPLPPPGSPAVEPMLRKRRYQPLGPDRLFADEQTAFVSDELGIGLALTAATMRTRVGPPPPNGYGATTLDLFSSLQYAINHSRNYRARMEDLYLAALDVTLERHLFTPRPFAQSTASYSGGQRDIDFRSALTATQSLGVRQQLPFGGEVVAEGLVTFIQAISDNSQSSEDASIVLRGSVPLLRGAGMVNLEPLIDAERSLVYEVRTFEEFRRSFVVDIASAYFSLINSQNRINNTLIRYSNSVMLQTRLEELYAAGLQNFLQVQQARQSRLSAENALINSQADYENQLDDFKLLIGMPVEEPLDVAGVALEVPIPRTQRLDLVTLAEKHRLILQTARDQIEDARRGVANAANGLLPDLELNARGQVGNREGDPASNIAGRTATYSAGLTLDLPLDRLRERNNYRAALISFERSQRNLVAVRDGITADVRTAARAVETAIITLGLQRVGIELAQRRNEYSNELLAQGQANARDVTDSQNALLDAQNNFDRARADLQIQILRLLRDTGTLRVDPKAGTLGTILDGPTLPDPSRFRIDSDFRLDLLRQMQRDQAEVRGISG